MGKEPKREKEEKRFVFFLSSFFRLRQIDFVEEQLLKDS